MGSPSIEVVADASICSDNGVSSVGSYDQIISQSDSGVSGSSSMTPVSPPRSTQASAANSPGSVARQQTPIDSPSRSVEPLRPPAPEQDAFYTGIQQLEMQQERGYFTPDHTQGYQPQRGRSLDASEDDHTDPSSSMTGNTGETPAGYTRSDNYASKTFDKIKKRMSSGDRKRSTSGGDDDLMDAALIDGYLEKLGRNGKWQVRWFETDGECLTYYKSSKRMKLLATLDLAKVGSIVIDSSDLNGCCFTINISERPYHLRAESKAACRDWVITLNRVKEARMQQGNVKLVASNQPPDLLDEHYTPRVVVVANRQRTRAVDDDDIHSWKGGAVPWSNPAGEWNDSGNPNESNPFVNPPSSNRLARWQKPRTSLSRLASKLVLWARSLRKYGCVDAENHVVLDHHVHPPGHDDKRKRTVTSPREHGTADVGEPQNNAIESDSIGHPVQSEEEIDDDDEETRELS
mmetsp:Transcript_19527/g.30084  ORF Transcript_19527/g.30084 Transcript_19527/m.30084 type:complete len:462 (-) Transcript_19527:215-1600(-)|eukprot:CAMPEP_0117024558 /NCGR_PEP_ID=MMETSP0472-20121206/18223_1 /TAXON_ID=693140 ORGANISM="Tiarina fusus, Strain LIS" /NCGR_SAMPLE_ID=MMETSP0472 /ASSEMBLY_ACC=CAM_ASM_000603 /LENGTH=461 /DNA_ID=CAMNT_0004731017 /DNA_START=360 /DNA_END=1745 /DNA_ORIENTATION=-